MDLDMDHCKLNKPAQREIQIAQSDVVVASKVRVAFQIPYNGPNSANRWHHAKYRMRRKVNRIRETELVEQRCRVLTIRR